MRVLVVGTLLISAAACVTPRYEGSESCSPVETPVSQVATPPADEAAVLATLPAGPSLFVTVQADDADPPTVLIDTPDAGVPTELSDAWADLAELERSDDVATHEWLMYLNGGWRALSLIIIESHEGDDGNGWSVLWRGDLVQTEASEP